jgi:hypothetical protein
VGVGIQLDVDEVGDGPTEVEGSGVGVGLAGALEVGSTMEVGSTVEVLEEGVGISTGEETSGVNVGVSAAFDTVSTEEERNVGVGTSDELTIDVTIDDDVVASDEDDELIEDAELESEDEEVVSGADKIAELEAELVIMSMVELEMTVGVSVVELDVMVMLDVTGSAVDVLEVLSMMDDELSKASDVTRELEEKSMLWLALLETDGPADDTCE